MYVPNLIACAERTKHQLSNACPRSRNGGVSAEICLRKARLFGWQGVEFFTGATYCVPYNTVHLTPYNTVNCSKTCNEIKTNIATVCTSYILYILVCF